MPKQLRRWTLALKVLPLAFAAVLLKFVLHRLGWEVISLSPLFSGLLAATVFLLGFLLSGVLTDYKESEKLPGELAVSLDALADECWIASRGKDSGEARALLRETHELAVSIRKWFYKEERTRSIMARLDGMNGRFLALETVIAPNFLARMKQEQSALRRVLIRIHTVRETSFVSSGYAIADITSTLLIAGLTLARIDPFYESLFFVGMITFLLTYMLRLIRDLDDPFDYGSGTGGPDEVPLKPLEDAEERLRRRLETLAPSA